MIRNLSIPKIGFGTWTIGGEIFANKAWDHRSLDALQSALDLGYTHFDTAEYYAGGHAEELLGQAIHASGQAREGLFITSKVSPEHLAFEKVLLSCEGSLRRLGMDYLDLYLIHWPKRGMDLVETFGALNKLVNDGKIRNLGVSNFNLSLMEESAALSETPLLTNQVSYSLPDRNYEKNGVLAYSQKNDILLTAYSPVKRRFIKANKPLQAIAKRHGVSPQQIALAWLVRQPRVITIPMSFNPQHQAENLNAADFELSDRDLAELAC
jgi:diketogulonate reductase-like aldo/keto reductase